MIASEIRLVASDIDGTLIRPDLSVSERTRAAVLAVRDRGIRVVLVTGRPVRWMDQLLDDLGPVDNVIAANGAVVLNGDLKEVLHHRSLEGEVALAFALALRAAHAEVAFGAERPSGFAHEQSYLPRWPDPHARVVELEELMREPMTKMLVRHEGHDSDALHALASGIAAEYAVALTYSSGDGLLEIAAGGVDKAAALVWLCQRHGISADEVVSFGDMPNDIPMLEWAGRSYAVANGHPLAKRAAKSAAPSNEDDGVARILDELLGL